MDRVKFYSEYDMASGWEINKVIERINDDSIDKEWTLEDVIEFFNILKYLQVERFADYIQEKTNVTCTDYIKKIKAKIGMFLGANKSVIISKHEEIDIIGTDDFLEVIEKYGIYKEIPSSEFKIFLNKDNVPLYIVLKYKKLVEYFDDIIKDKIISDSYNAETILSRFLDDKGLYLPPSLTEKDILKLIDDYIELDAERVNINVLRKIIHFPVGVGLNITDKIRLHATRKEKEESEKIFGQGTGIESSVSVSYEKGLDEAIKFDTNGSATKVSIVVSRDWIEKNKDYPTLWNNFIYLFGIVDSKARLTMVSKKNEVSALASAFMPSGTHLYRTSFIFGFKEMVANAQLYSYIQVLNVLGIRVENMIEWFFNSYLADEFSITDFIIKLPSDSSSYFEKCRTILPEIDRIFKQYNVLIEDGEIDQELIQISSSSVKVNEVKSFISRKYAYPIGEWYQTATFLLFSDQSSIFYLPDKDEKFKNFLELIVRDNVSKKDFQEYQIQRMNWLFDNGIVFENEEGFIKIVDIKTIFILKELYNEDVLNYFRYESDLREIIDSFEENEIVKFESSLLTRNEQDYLDFYLNKSKFTNGYDIRNSYLHGTNMNDERKYESDYYSILKLLIIIVLKINDDLCLKEMLEE
ncbi:hypothetical protein [Anaerovorax sp. IOR16]|uniref:hypothetical protein n=1 Tax=Anaerovorax sp. IOR16 TaxID=2773458 RepID=UPI0019D05119|nr:hypothetical protein [Anaerovorax sp. IOR16]